MEDKEKIAFKPAVILATLESHLHEVNSIESGIKLYNAGRVKRASQDVEHFRAYVDVDGTPYGVAISFTRDGLDIKSHLCSCRNGNSGQCLCKHIVAAVLELQGGLALSKLMLGKTAYASANVGSGDTAEAAGSGSLEVLSTPRMIALIERAACECLADCLEPGQTSVGTKIEVSHTAASPLGAPITATAAIESVFGRTIGFEVAARDGFGEIGRGKHTRVIVDAGRFTKKAQARKQ
jgi:predicted thioesterase